jgi:EAL domain-containing protein (putative c-di-GMP-specific phosphodiesterase class I)
MPAEIAEVRRALENEEIVPFFQLLVELHTGRLAGFEVLARWQHPKRGPILPANFISLAEENGLVEELMQQIMRKTFQSASLFPEPLVLAVNVSPSRLQDLTLPKQIRDAAEQAGFSFGRLMIEIPRSSSRTH